MADTHRKLCYVSVQSQDFQFSGYEELEEDFSADEDQTIFTNVSNGSYVIIVELSPVSIYIQLLVSNSR